MHKENEFMKLNNEIFEVFDRDNFTYRKNNEELKKLFQVYHNTWREWCTELFSKFDNFDKPIVKAWQNSGYIYECFWTRFKYNEYLNSPICLLLHLTKDNFSIELSYKMKNSNVDFSKNGYKNSILSNIGEWIKNYDINTKLFYICSGKNKWTLEEYFNESEKQNWVSNTDNIIIAIGVTFTKEEALNLQSTSKKLNEIIMGLINLYEKVQETLKVDFNEKREVSYWLGGANYDDGDMSEEFIKKKVYAIGWKYEDIKEYLEDEEKLNDFFDRYEMNNHSRKMFNLFFKIKKGDKLAIKSTFAKGKKSMLRIKAIGTAESDAKIGYKYDEELGHTIPVRWGKVDQIDYENIGGYWDTIKEVIKEEHIIRIFKDVNYKINIAIENYTKQNFLEDAFIDEEKYNKIVNRLERKKNIILQGAPGVGKSYLAKKIAYSILGEFKKENVEMIQFHQSYSYEDFIMGYRPNKSGGFDILEGVFYKFCKKAISNQNEKYYFIIDEINRGNLSKIFGELMLLIENDKRGENFAMGTIYSEEKFFIPENLYIIGLMNTADRSLALIDYALRRRFSFIDIEPAFGENFKKYIDKYSHTNLRSVLNIIEEINNDIENDESLGKGFKIGHSYFCNLDNGSDEELLEIIECDIVPLLEEYWIENGNKAQNYAQRLYEDLRYE
ncbi:hypothetical protein FDB34_14370 [Clostridium botulinum]|nr:hypothetical protein [Clostridium botulinum]